MLAHQLHLGEQIRKFHGDRTGRFQPYQLGGGAEFAAQILYIHRIKEGITNAIAGQLMLGEILVRAVSVVRNQHLIALAEQRQRNGADGRQTAGHQQALLPAFERA